MTDEKTLEEYTVAELKEIAQGTGKIESLSAMKKADLISAIEAARDEIVETVEKDVSSEPAKEKPKKKAGKAPEKSEVTVLSLKEKMGMLKQKKDELEKGDRMGTDRLRRRINRLKKRTRIVARAAS
ncbi:MAG: Rho termination factor N-terminal domain-containing protein [Deltaproteobacteria bacterium]|nr:Rho termination factor N-terminal domain-containing protein [Deltaproteobacteria bacterium]